MELTAQSPCAVRRFIDQGGIEVESVFGGEFKDDQGGLKLKHDRKGLLSMANYVRPCAVIAPGAPPPNGGRAGAAAEPQGIGRGAETYPVAPLPTGPLPVEP